MRRPFGASNHSVSATLFIEEQYQNRCASLNRDHRDSCDLGKLIEYCHSLFYNNLYSSISERGLIPLQLAAKLFNSVPENVSIKSVNTLNPTNINDKVEPYLPDIEE